MRNPLRSEAEAYRFLWLTIVYFAAIVLASLVGGRWWGVGVFVLLTAVGAWLFLRREETGEMTREIPARRPADQKRILVVANETVGGQTLRETIRDKAAGGPSQVLVVTPALNSPLKYWVSDEDDARAAAQRRLDASLARLAADGISARGEVGDSEPLTALEDALRTFGADEIIISTHPEGRSHWLEQGLVTKARERFTVPITHVVVDLEAER
ncbi:MAG: universal stress protein [Actinobacteria bacterium]|nr:MAG: universal stress protein [Actinomycetota bacterium]